MSYARSALTLRAELSKLLCVLCELLRAVVVTHASKRSPVVSEASTTASAGFIFDAGTVWLLFGLSAPRLLVCYR